MIHLLPTYPLVVVPEAEAMQFCQEVDVAALPGWLPEKASPH